MLHFTKNVEAFSRFSLELRAGNSEIKVLKSVGVDVEEAIFNGFKIDNPNLGCLICVRHLRKRDEEKTLKLLEKTNQTAAQTSKSKKEILNDINEENEDAYYEYGLAKASD